MLLTTGTPVMATGGFGAPCINNCILYSDIQFQLRADTKWYGILILLAV